MTTKVHFQNVRLMTTEERKELESLDWQEISLELWDDIQPIKYVDEHGNAYEPKPSPDSHFCECCGSYIGGDDDE